VYAFDRASGKPMWPAPARLSHQLLVTDLPTELPILVLARNPQNIADSRPQQVQGAILCLDKRTGRVLYEDDKLPPQVVTAIDALGNPDDHTIALQMPPDAITLKFSSTPIAPEPPFQDGAFERPLSALERTRAGSIIRALGGLLSPGLQIQIEKSDGNQQNPRPQPAAKR
jgi:hypothetical protein